MRTQGRDIPIGRNVNYCTLGIVVIFLMVHSLLEVISQVNRLTVHIKPQLQAGCNGHKELCDRKYSNITHIATHGSAFVGIMPTENQNVDITAQLDAGIRFLQVQTHRNVFGKLSLCHTSCLMEDAGLLEDYLAVIKEWLDKRPQEVVTVLLTNSDFHEVKGADFEEPFQQSGIVPYAYIPPPPQQIGTKRESLDSWPTLGEMIANGTRLVAFLDKGADRQRAPYLLNEFSYFWETPYDTTDSSFAQCVVDRPKELVKFPEAMAARMYIMNHFLDTNIKIGGVKVPDRRDAARTNAATGKGSIGVQAELCTRIHGRAPAAILVDYFDKGEVFKVQNVLNGLR
ncbi:MAG: hypothetical protein LQ351_002888 [Letrouitia transgressa]|nr:MAG: hypothetical protein LQ351_002888 [Letrouitia transgressa]